MIEIEYTQSENSDKCKFQVLRPIESPYNGQRLQSQAHAIFLQTFYGAKVRLANPDGNNQMEIQEYKTSSKVTVKELDNSLNKHGE